MADRPVYLTPQGFRDRLEGVVSIKTLAEWRSKRLGPPYIKAGAAVLYPIADVEAWEKGPAGRDAELRTRTSVALAAGITFFVPGRAATLPFSWNRRMLGDSPNE